MDSGAAAAAAAAAPLSLVSRAKTALSSAAAKAEKVLTDIKADLKSDRDADGSLNRAARKSGEQEPAVADAGDPIKPRPEASLQSLKQIDWLAELLNAVVRSIF